MRGILIKRECLVNKSSFLIMPDVSEWNALCARCKSVYEKYGSTPIPTTLSDDPCQVFLETRVDENAGRFVVFILWLKKQHFLFGWYALIPKNHPQIFDKCLIQLSLL